MRPFKLGPDVHANVRALRTALGSVTDDLSYAKFASIISDRLASLPSSENPGGVSTSQVQRWAKDSEPDIDSIGVMADLAGVTFEEFARGAASRPSAAERLAAVNRVAMELVTLEAQERHAEAASARSRFDDAVHRLFPNATADTARTFGDAMLDMNRFFLTNSTAAAESVRDAK